jgi:tRNA-Thr(GGU) m(6)t(6)A37 methyltransferase TsaA
MEIRPVAVFRSPLTSKFGVPRQSGLCPALQGRVVFEPPYRKPEAVRGIEDFSHLWLLWGFSANGTERQSLTVRPPRLGGNRRVGVFASRSPFRPNGLALSSVRLCRVEPHPTLGPVLHVSGADLMDGTAIYDVKPYLPYADSHPNALGGFTDTRQWQPLRVEMAEPLAARFTTDELQALRQCLSQDPRPHYHDDATRVYGMPFAGRDIRFTVANGCCTVVDVETVDIKH